MEIAQVMAVTRLGGADLLRRAMGKKEFMAAVMNCDIHLTDKLGGYKREVDRLGIGIVAPCVNRSEATFTVRGQDRLRARRAQECRGGGDAAHHRRARRQRSRSRACSTSRRASI